MDPVGSSGDIVPELPVGISDVVADGQTVSPAELPGAPSTCVPDESVSAAQSGSVHEAIVGTVIDGRYQIQSLIGVGGMSAVYKAHHLALNKLVAVKMLHRHLCSERSSLERFLREGRTENSVRHPNLVAVQSVGVTTDGRVYMVMDYLEGKSLDELLSLGGAIPQQSAVSIFLQLCDALSYAHGMGIIHRDLKPSNVMLVGPNLSIVKIVDFGIAKYLGDNKEKQGNTTAGIVGSPPYMSPEQCLSKSPDSRSDIYSLGCLMYETLTGKLPLDGDSHYAMICRHLNDTPARFSAVAPSLAISTDLETIVFKAMEKLPERRWQSCDALKQELKKLEFGSPVGENRSRLDKWIGRPQELNHSHASPESRARIRKTSALLVLGVIFTVVSGVTLANINGIKGAFLTPVYQKKLAEAQARYGSNSLEAADATVALADCLWETGQIESAKQLCLRTIGAYLRSPYRFPLSIEKQLQYVQRAVGGQPDEQQLFMALGETSRHMGETGKAKRLFEASLEARKGLPYIQEQALIELAEMASSNADYLSEQRYVERGLSILQNDKTSTASQLLLLAFLLKRAECDEFLSEPESAVESYRKALPLMAGTGRVDVLRRGNVLQSLARCLIKAGRGDEADGELLQAISEYKKVTPVPLHEVAECYRVLASYFLQKSDFPTAEKYYSQCLALSAYLNQAEILEAEELLADCFYGQHKFAQQKALLQKVIAALKNDASEQERIERLEDKLARNESVPKRK